MAKISKLPELLDPTGAETVVLLRDNFTQRANLEKLLAPQVRRADMLLQAAVASSNYFALRTSGEATTPVGKLFSTGDGAGNLIFFERTATGSTEIARTIAPVTLAGRVVRHLSEFGVVPNAGYDQTDALNAAFAAAKRANAIVLTRQGEAYRHSGPVTLPDGTVWQMNRATLIATDPIKIALFIGNDTHVLGGGRFLSPDANARRSELYASRIVATGARWTLEDVDIDGAASVGIMKFGCSFGHLIRPVVRNTQADGIHTTYGSNNNTTIDPLVENVGDDCVAYVAYTGDGRTIDNEVLIGGRGRYSHARGLTAIGVRNFVSTTWYAEGCRGAGVYTGGELAGSVEANNSFGTMGVLIDAPTIINCANDTSLGHAPIMVFGRDGTNPNANGAAISRRALSTRIVNPTIGGGAGASAALRIDYGAESTQISNLKARDVISTDRKPNVATIAGHDTTLTGIEGVSVGGNGVIVTAQATGFVRIERAVLTAVGTQAPEAYSAAFGCDAASKVSRVDIIDAVITDSPGLPFAIGGSFPDGALRMLGTTVDGQPVSESDPVAERYLPGNRFDLRAAGAPRSRQVRVEASQVATYLLAARVQARISITATYHADQNVKLFADEILFYDAADTSGTEGVDYVKLPSGGYYCRRVRGASFGNAAIDRRLVIVNGEPALTIGAAAKINVTVSAVINRKEG